MPTRTGRMRKAIRVVLSVVPFLATACTAGFVPASEAVTVTVENRSPRDVTIRAVHHVDLVDFQVAVPRGEERTFRVTHRAFGPGPVAFEIWSWLGRRGTRFRGDEEVRIPPASAVTIVVREDPRASTVQVRRRSTVARAGG